MHITFFQTFLKHCFLITKLVLCIKDLKSNTFILNLCKTYWLFKVPLNHFYGIQFFL